MESLEGIKEDKKSFVISIVAGKGGVGKTSISTNLSWIIAKRFGFKTLLIDANITSSHVASFLRIPTTYTLNDLLDEGIIDTSKFYTYGEVLDVLPAKILGKKHYLNSKAFKNIIENLRGSYEVIVIDSAPGIGNEALSAIEASDTCLIVTTPYFPSVVDIIRVKEVLEEMKNKRARIVLNMVENKFYELTINEIKYATGLPVIGVIPFEEGFIESVARGNLISRFRPSSKFAKSIEKIAYTLLSERYPINYSRNLFERFFNIFIKPRV